MVNNISLVYARIICCLFLGEKEVPSLKQTRKHMRCFCKHTEEFQCIPYHTAFRNCELVVTTQFDMKFITSNKQQYS